MAKKTKVTYTEKYPVVGTFKEQKELQKYYKGLTDTELAEWCVKEGLEYKPCPEQPAIHRMRMAMAVLYKHFPKEPSKAKATSPYAKYTTDELIVMALDNSVPVEVTEDMKIMRMRTIMALRAHGVLEAIK